MPSRHEPRFDLARFYAQQEEYDLALKELKAGLKIKPSERAQIENDPAFAALKKARPQQWQSLYS